MGIYMRFMRAEKGGQALGTIKGPRIQDWDSLVSIETIDHVLLKGVDTETVYVVDASIHSFDGIEVVNVV
jgi:hypothetical protein